MKQLEERHYMSDDNKVIIRKSDNYHMGTDLYLSEVDSIDNYEEQDMSEEEKIYYEQLSKQHELHHEDIKTNKKKH